ncbi:MAG: preprotein translocase subunit SecG [Campylobacteraceae bacterium]
MASFLLIVQFILVAIITVAVLLQKSSSIGLGAYSGSNESLFGAKGPAGFLAKFTFVVGFLFMVNTLALGYIYNKQTKTSIVDTIVIPEGTPLTNGTTMPTAPLAPSAPSTTTK